MDIQITLKNGEKVKVNDHVYCSPSWSVRDGTPYSIARIMEFLPPEDLSHSPRAQLLAAQRARSNTSKGKNKESYTRVRLAWYYRPSDVSDRAVADSRLLLAAIYSEVCEVSQLRAKCYVIHRDKLSDLSGWKKKPDHFYFYRAFDPYIKREFEVLLSTDVRNLPAHIKDVLVSRYEYVVAEKEVVHDLTDTLRLCETCGEWCAHIDAVQCHRCKHHFHMSCVSPPLVAKPARGYGWTCAPCSRRHEDQVDSGEAQSAGASDRDRGSTPNNSGGVSANGVSNGTTNVAVAIGPNGVKIGPNGKPVRGRGRPRKEKPSGTPTTSEEELQVKHYKLWPFRYFGLYTVAEDTLDPNDLIFPRAATRVGPKYQAFVAPAVGEPIPPVPGLPASVTNAANPVGEEERGGDNTIEVFSCINEFTPEEVGIVEAHMHKIAHRKDLLSNVDWLTEVIRRYSQAHIAGRPMDSVNMKSQMRQLKWKKHETRYTDLPWNDAQIAAFEAGIAQYGAELRSVREEVGTRSMPEVVRFYGKWKNARLREENERLRDPTAYSSHKILRSDDDSPANSHSDEEESSIVDVLTSAARSTTYCAACRTRESRQWWKAPKGLASAILCDSCGLNWRKYADLSARPTTREETSIVNGTSSAVGAKTRSGEKREGTPLTAPTAKRARASTNGAASTSTPPPAAPPPQPTHLRCYSCYSAGALGKVLRCTVCDFRVHAGACGVVLEPEAALKWVCDICQNEKEPEASLTYSCLLCPKPKKDAKKSQFYPPSDTYLRACKPSEGQGWVHVLCSVFIPEIQYADSSRLRLVEGISTIPKERWTGRCTLCHEDGGAVVQCANCPKKYHVSCAWKYGHKFGFEIQAVKSSRREHTSMVTFKRVTGAMNAVVFCKEHPSYKRDVYDICATNDVGETALQIYCRTYKQAPIAPHGLLRRARRLDHILPSTLNETSKHSSDDSGGEDQTCAVCSTDISPCFYDKSPSGEDITLCHRCYHQRKHAMETDVPMISAVQG